MARPGYWTGLTPLLQHFFFCLFFLLRGLWLTSFALLLWFPASAPADPDLLLLLSNVEPQLVCYRHAFRGPVQAAPERCHSIWGGGWGVGGDQGLGPPLSALLCLLNLRASVRTGKPGKRGTALHPFLGSISCFCLLFLAPGKRPPAGTPPGHQRLLLFAAN